MPAFLFFVVVGLFVFIRQRGISLVGFTDVVSIFILVDAARKLDNQKQSKADAARKHGEKAYRTV